MLSSSSPNFATNTNSRCFPPVQLRPANRGHHRRFEVDMARSKESSDQINHLYFLSKAVDSETVFHIAFKTISHTDVTKITLIVNPEIWFGSDLTFVFFGFVLLLFTSFNALKLG